LPIIPVQTCRFYLPTCVRRQATHAHVTTAAKRNVQYLLGARTRSLILRGEDELPCVYADANYGGEKGHNQSGIISCIMESTVGASRKQPVVALPTTEAEYIALTAGCQELSGRKIYFVILGIIAILKIGNARG
jgi:hypothetical protein